MQAQNPRVRSGEKIEEGGRSRILLHQINQDVQKVQATLQLCSGQIFRTQAQILKHQEVDRAPVPENSIREQLLEFHISGVVSTKKAKIAKG